MPLTSPAGVDLTNATDGNLANFSPTIPEVNGKAAAVATLNGANPIKLIGARFRNLQQPVYITLRNALGNSVVDECPVASNNTNIRIWGLLDAVTTIEVASAAPFGIFDLAAVSVPIQEFVTLDLGAEYLLKEIRTKHWAGTSNASHTELLIGNYSDSLFTAVVLNPNEIAYLPTVFPLPISGRFVRIALTVVPDNFKRFSVFEVAVFATLAPPGVLDPIDSTPPLPTDTTQPITSGWNPNAGLYLPLSKGAVAVSSSDWNAANTAALVHDSDFSTSWTSTNPLPDRYVTAPTQNVFSV